MLLRISYIISLLCINLYQSYPYYPECATFNPNSTILNTLNGKISGKCYDVSVNYGSKPLETSQVLTWLSVPFAEPPTGNLRFHKPRPVKSWNTTLDGTNWPMKCIQITDFASASAAKGFKVNKAETSEDCLYLNIFVPYNVYLKSVIEKNPKYRAPIMVWIHGGAFLLGTSVDDRIEPSTIVSMSNIIVISIQYRLGLFGFLHIKNTPASGNQGILDQSLALKWIHSNADRFGGDRTKITIAGQSAGSWSVGHHMMYKPSWPYFRNAILESGTPLQTTFKLISSDEATKRAFKFGESVSCAQNASETSNQQLFECLQLAQPNVISTASLFGFLSLYNYSQLAYQKYVSLFPLVIDGEDFKETARQAFESGRFKKCNIIAGTTTKETANLVTISSYFGSNYQEYEAKANLNYTYFRFLLEDYFNFYPTQDPQFIDKLIELYVPFYEQLDETTNYYTHFIQITSDQLFRCPTIHLAELYSRFNLNAYVYLYGYRIPTTLYPLIYGSPHSDEIPLVYGEPLSVKTPPLISDNPWTATGYNYSQSDRLFAERIVKYWTNFVQNDNPNDLTQSDWLKFKPRSNLFSQFLNGMFDIRNRNVIYLNGNNKTRILNYMFYDDQVCRFWQK